MSSLPSEWQRPATMPAVELGGIGISVLSTDTGKREPSDATNTLRIEETNRCVEIPDDMMQSVACVAGPLESKGSGMALVQTHRASIRYAGLRS